MGVCMGAWVHAVAWVGFENLKTTEWACYTIPIIYTQDHFLVEIVDNSLYSDVDDPWSV